MSERRDDDGRIIGLLEHIADRPGISLRDYFAAMAMQGSLAAFTMSGALDAFTSEGYKADPTGGDRDGFAQWCYGIADALLVERAK